MTKNNEISVYIHICNTNIYYCNTKTEQLLTAVKTLFRDTLFAIAKMFKYLMKVDIRPP